MVRDQDQLNDSPRLKSGPSPDHGKLSVPIWVATWNDAEPWGGLKDRENYKNTTENYKN